MSKMEIDLSEPPARTRVDGKVLIAAVHVIACAPTGSVVTTVDRLLLGLCVCVCVCVCVCACVCVLG